jgi:hypothetical protein
MREQVTGLPQIFIGVGPTPSRLPLPILQLGSIIEALTLQDSMRASAAFFSCKCSALCFTLLFTL